MRKPTAVLDIDLAEPSWQPMRLDRFGDVRVLLRLHGEPVAFAVVPMVDGRPDAAALRRFVLEQHRTFVTPLLRRAFDGGRGVGEIDLIRLLASDSTAPGATPLVTVAVCTRNRTKYLAACLDALLALDYLNLDLIVVDNDPADDRTEGLVRDRYPAIRYVREPRRGLDWARNRAILECRGEILAFTDDDVIVDRQWVAALVAPFTADPEAMAVTGLVIPHALETESQRLFEAYGGFGRGFDRRWYRAPAGRPIAMMHGGTGKFGTGANMAFRRTLFDRIGGFDPALDVGTCTNGGGDLEMFFRVLKTGHTLVYAPAAIVRHRHRSSYAELRTQIADNGVGFSAYLRRSYSAWPDERLAVVKLGLWWFRWWHLRRLLRSFIGREPIPRDLMYAELHGALVGSRRYRRAAARAAEIAKIHAGEPEPASCVPHADARQCRGEAIRTIDIAEPLRPVADVAGYDRLRVIVLWRHIALGSVSIDHFGATVNTSWLADAIVQQLGDQLLGACTRYGTNVEMTRLATALADAFDSGSAQPATTPPALPADMSVSVVVATRDRASHLRRCLTSLVGQRTPRRVEIIVADNNPDSGVTPDIVNEFSGVVLVSERRGGLSYARNRGISAATGEIVITTDDDVTCPPDWIERLVAPFSRADVMAVTGNVLPAVLETAAERLFEAYGGLSRGFEPLVVDHDWFLRWRRAVPTWRLGCTANAAFRTRIFADPEIGLLDEALGAGTPTGCSEDTYLFYRVLKAGYAIAYEPSAIVWHHHRQTEEAVRRQIYSYSKGHVAYQITTWMNDADRRALVRLGYELPRIYMHRAWLRVRRRSDYPLSFIGLEVLGCLAGPFALWRSRRRVARLGKSGRLAQSSIYGVQLESRRAEVTKA